MLTLEQVFFPCTTPQNVWRGIGVKIKVSFYYAVLLFYVVVYAAFALFVAYFSFKDGNILSYSARMPFYDGLALWRSHCMMVLFNDGLILYEGLILWQTYFMKVAFYDDLILWSSHFMVVLFYEGLILWWLYFMTVAFYEVACVAWK